MTTLDTQHDQRVSSQMVVNAITVIAVVVFWLIMTYGRPWELFERAGFSADFYDEQARAFLRGHLAVDPAIPGPEGFVIGSKTYLYYGPWLSVVRMPLMLFGDLFVGRLVRVSMLLALVVLCRWSARLARAGGAVFRSVARNDPDSDVDERWAVGLFTAAVAFSPSLFASGWITVYHETELWALTLAVITITLIVEWAASEFADRRLVLWAGAAALATTLTRAPIGVGLCLGLIGCGAWLVWRQRSQGWRAISAGWVPMAAGGFPVAVHAAVNWAKFGSLFGVPGGRQLLSLQNPTRAAWFAGNNESFFSSRFLPTTLVQYLRPDALGFERLWPVIRFGPLATNRGSYPVETITPATSLTLSATLLLILAIAGTVWMLRHRCRTWLLLVVVTAIGALPSFMIGFVANRYLIDMLPPLVAAGALGVWVVLALPHVKIVRGLGIALAIWGLWVNGALAIWTIGYKTAGFTEFRYAVDRAVFGDGDAPALIELVPGAPVPRDGIVALDPDCAGVYMSEQGRWVALELADGRRSTSGVIPNAGDIADDVMLAAGRGWTLRFVNAAGSARVEIVDDDSVVVFEQSVELADATRITGAGPLAYQVVIDPVSNQVYAQIGDVGVPLPGDVVVTGGPIDGSEQGATAMSPLCVELRRSL